MVIKKSVTKSVFGDVVTYDEAYHKITSVEGNKETLNVQLTAYKNEEKSIALHTQNFEFIPDDNEDSIRWDKQAYEFIKAQPEFENAIDC